MAAVAHPEAALLDPELHELALADAERRLGRALTAGERRIDLVRLDRDLAAGKARLVAAIETERRSAARRFARDAVAGRSPRMRLHLSPSIRGALRGLYDAGRSAGRGELRRAGLDPDRLPRALAAVPARLAVIEERMNGRLRDLGVDSEHRLAVAFDLSAASQAAIVRAVQGLPGVRSIAADFTSVPAFAGLGSVWEEADAAGVVTAWTYTAVMDDGTCEECAGNDGDTYESWDAIQAVLPDGGPNPDCDGGDRCRCRAVPEFGDLGTTSTEPEPPPVPEFMQPVATDLSALQSGYLTDIEAQQRAAETGNAAGFHPYLYPESHDLDLPAPVQQAQHEALMRVGGTIADEIDSRFAQVESTHRAALDRIAAEREARMPEMYEADTRRSQVIDDVYNALVRDLQPQTDEDWNSLTLRLNADPRVEAADRALETVRERLFALTREANDHRLAIREAREQTLLDVLGEIRDFGPTDEIALDVTGSAAGRTMLDDASHFYPRDWIERTGRIDVQFGERGWHRQNLEALARNERAHTIQLSEANRETVGIHELAHAQEYEDARLRNAEWVFYNYRSRGRDWGADLEPRVPLGGTYRADEFARPDEWYSAYVGKDYGASPTSYYEILTMGLQALWRNPDLLDPEYRAWLLAVLATF